MTKRKALSKKTRFDVFKRDGFACAYCGAHPPEVILHVDHIIAVAAGGSNDADNLITACSSCNLGKGARDLRVAPKTVAEKAALLRDMEDQLRGYEELQDERRSRIWDYVWDVVEAYETPDVSSYPKDRLSSIKRFVESLGRADVLRAVDITTFKNIHSDYARWKYFCGVCWGMLRQREENHG